MVEFNGNVVAAAVRTNEDLEVALKSKSEVIFLLKSDILTLEDKIIMIHKAKKKICLHVDFMQGIGKDKSGINYIKNLGVDYISSTRTNIIKMGKELGIKTIQRFFIIDSHSVSTAVDATKQSKPDIVEVMPGVVTKKLAEISSLVDVPVIVGGLVETKEEVIDAIKAGAILVSTGNRDLWALNITK
ncbi:MAG: glycerol-3-phosphate responsive antiterminator [Peptostreptococcaceae bacterium]|nr:glycerol-3-phosphate responsive antiterminator [Peptostreptococcaceae bacterium]